MEPTASDSTCDVPMPRTAPATTGSIDLRVRYCECDPMGVAHHASFAPWLEMARTELLRTSGVSYAQLEAAGVLLVVARIAISYHRPARYDDLLRIAATVQRARGVKIDHRYEVRLRARADAGLPAETQAGSDALLASATTTLACVDGRGVPQRLPAWLCSV